MSSRRLLILVGILVTLVLVPLASFGVRGAQAASSIPWNMGDVFAGVSNGQYNVYDHTGALKDSVNDGHGGFTTGCAFNGGLDKLYTTNFTNTKVEVYDNAIPHTLSQTVDTAANGGSASESVVFASNGDFYVGNAGATAILRYNAAGAFQQSYTAATEARGTDWLDLAADQKTLFYTSEGGRILRLDVSGAGTQLADFANIGGVSYALRLLPPGDGSGGLLVANSTAIKRLDGAGNVVKTYVAPGENSWFSLNLDPNGTSFWAGDFGTGDFFRFNIATGAVEVGPINTGTGAGTLFGICVKGEPTAGLSHQWGVDSSFAPITQSFYNQITTTFGAPDFWGRYIGTGSSKDISLSEATVAHANGFAILPIYFNYDAAAVTGYAIGQKYAVAAITDAQQRLHIPQGVAIFSDIEGLATVHPDAAFIQGWYDTFNSTFTYRANEQQFTYQAGYYKAGYYANTSATANFVTPFCAAVNLEPAIGSNTFLWTNQVSQNITSQPYFTKAGAPAYQPLALSCANQQIPIPAAWQYGLRGTTNNVNIDEAVSSLPLWHP